MPDANISEKSKICNTGCCWIRISSLYYWNFCCFLLLTSWAWVSLHLDSTKFRYLIDVSGAMTQFQIRFRLHFILSSRKIYYRWTQAYISKQFRQLWFSSEVLLQNCWCDNEYLNKYTLIKRQRYLFCFVNQNRSASKYYKYIQIYKNLIL